MKHLFVARHGSYGADERINDCGRQQMVLLGQAIKSIINGSSAYIISSTAPRALDSSRILAAELALPPEFEQMPYLWTGTDAPKENYVSRNGNDTLMEIINERREKADGLIVVSHLEVTEYFPRFFLTKEFGQGKWIGEIAKGQAVHIDLEARTYEKIPREGLIQEVSK